MRYLILFLCSIFAKNNGFSGIIAFLVFSYFISNLLKKIETKTLKIPEIFLTFTVIFIGNLYWIYEPLTIELEKYIYFIPFAIILLPCYLAIYPTLALYILSKLCNRYNFLLALVFALLMTLSELLYSNLFTGFTWTLFGYIWSGNIIPLQITYFIGIYGLSFLSYLASALLGIYVNNKNKSAIKIGISIISLIWIFGIVRLSTAPDISFTNYKVKIVQGNIKQKDKINYLKYRNIVNKYLELSQNEQVDLLIWPEATIPWLYSLNTEKEIHHILSDIFNHCKSFAFGCIRQNNLNEVFNSIIILSKTSDRIEQKFYDKIHLVPFGEYIPLKKYIPINSIANELNGFNIGYQNKVFKLEQSPVFLFQICYEDIFYIDKKSLKTADCIINITNDGWFGNSLEAIQHHYIARTMSIIYGLPTIRVNNHGYSGVFDSYGRTIINIPLDKEESKIFYVPNKINK